MNLLDMRTVLFSYTLSNVICLLVMFILYRDHRKRFPELKFLLIDYVCNFLGVILISLRGILPDLFSIIVANVLLVGGSVLLIYGLGIFVGKRVALTPYSIMLVIFVLVHAYFTYSQVSLTARNINLTAASLFVLGQGAWLMLRRVGTQFRSQARLVGIIFAVYSVVFIVRIILEASVPQSNNIFQSNLTAIVVMVLYQMLFILLTYALFLMINRRLVAELETDLLARKKNEEALADSEQKFALAFQNSPDALTITAIEDGRIIEVNESFFRMTEYSEEEVFGKSTVELNLWFNPNGRDEYIQLLRQKRRVLNYETTFRKKSGDLFTGLVSSGIIQFNDRVCTLNVIHDISDRVKSEQALRESEVRFRSYVENASDIVYSLTPDRVFSYVSPNWIEILGNEPADVIGKPFDSFVHPEDLPTTKEFLERMIAGVEKSGGVEYRVRHMDGSWHPHFSKVSVMRDETGKPSLLIGIARDMTGYRKAEESLRANENLLNKIFDILPVGLWLADKNGKLVRSNSAGRKIWGGERLVEKFEYGVYKARRLPSREEIGPQDWALAHTIAEHTTVVDEVLEIDAFDNQKRTILNSTAPVLDANGQLEAAVIVNLDITERQRIEDTLRFLAERDGENTESDFFRALAHFLSDILGMDYVCIDRLEPDGLAATTVAVYDKGAFEDNCTYTLKETPCGDVVGKTICVFPDQVCQLFPNDAVLQQMGAESYIGTTLWSTAGDPIGLIAIIGRSPLANPKMAETILQLVTVRAAGELERRQAEAKLAEQMTELRRWNEATLGREMRVIELKNEINELLTSAGQPPRYASESAPLTKDSVGLPLTKDSVGLSRRNESPAHASQNPGIQEQDNG